MRLGHAVASVVWSISVGSGRVLGQSRERQDRGGGGADDDLKFPFHIFIFFRVLFFFRGEPQPAHAFLIILLSCWVQYKESYQRRTLGGRLYRAASKPRRG